MSDSPSSGASDEETVAAGGAAPSTPTGRLSRGSALGRYLVLERVGVGGMGEVYAAYDPELDRKLAIKLLHVEAPGSTGSSAGTPRLLREAQAMARLTHANVLTVHDVGTFGERVFVAMEFVEGSTLKDWLRDEHDPQEVLSVFRAAGRGLAAAHEAGIVHRDFKPENVLMGIGERVLVADFGLARATGELETSEAQPPAQPATLSSSSGTLDGRLTQTGAVMGTPAYMAPEQHLGKVADERSDQFSFCVALYEALFKQRPFRGDTVAARAIAVMQGTVREPPARSSVPGRVRRAVLKGLAKQPDDRHPNMAALLVELRAHEGGRRNLWAAAGVTLLGLAIGIGVATNSTPDLCPSAETRFAGVWDQERAAAVQAAVLATELDFAADAWAPTAAALDAYRSEWLAMHRDACEATHVRGEQSADMLDRRTGCLNDRFRRFEALVDVLSEPGVEVLTHAGEMAASLPSVEFCGDTGALAARIPPPEDPATREQVQELRGKLSRAEALLTSAQVQKADKFAEPLVDDARALGYRPLVAEALHVRGSVRVAADRGDEGAKDLDEAIAAALASGHSEYIARPALALEKHLSKRLARYDEADRLHRLASAAIEHLGGNEALEADALVARGGSLYRRGELEAAREAAQLGVDKLTELHGPDHPALVAGLTALGTVMYGLGDYDAMATHSQRAVDIYERHYGAKSPKIATPLNNVAVVHIMQAEYEQAVPLLERVVALRTAYLGPDHIRVIDAQSNLGITLDSLGRPGEAEPHLRKALDVYRERYGEESEGFAEASINLAATVVDLERYDEAKSLLHGAVRALEKIEDPSQVRLAYSLSEIGNIAHEQGDEDEALAMGKRALDLVVAGIGADNPRGFNVRVEYAETLAETGRYDEARNLVEPYLAAIDKDGDPRTVSGAHFIVASALGELPSERARAIAEAERALSALGDTREKAGARRAKIERLLAKLR